MSHIVKGKLRVSLTDEQCLIKALEHIGKVERDSKLYRAGFGYTRERYQIVVVDQADEKFRIGFNLNRNTGAFEQFHESGGSYERWARKHGQRAEDFYMAHLYERNLVENEGYEVDIYEDEHGVVQLVAEEPMY